MWPGLFNPASNLQYVGHQIKLRQEDGNSTAVKGRKQNKGNTSFLGQNCLLWISGVCIYLYLFAV